MGYSAVYEMAAQEVKQSVSVVEAAERWGYRPNRNGFLCCPFHREKTASLRLWEDHYHCFGCGAGGDVIEFTRRLHDINFKDALEMLNDEFSLGLSLGKNVDFRARRRAQEERERRMLEAARLRDQARRINVRCDKAWTVWDFYDWCRRCFAPQSMEEELHPLYVMAVKYLPAAAAELEEAQTARWEFEQRGKEQRTG